jgi:hypothetical protein
LNVPGFDRAAFPGIQYLPHAAFRQLIARGYIAAVPAQHKVELGHPVSWWKMEPFVFLKCRNLLGS